MEPQQVCIQYLRQLSSCCTAQFFASGIGESVTLTVPFVDNWRVPAGPVRSAIGPRHAVGKRSEGLHRTLGQQQVEVLWLPFCSSGWCANRPTRRGLICLQLHDYRSARGQQSPLGKQRCAGSHREDRCSAFVWIECPCNAQAVWAADTVAVGITSASPLHNEAIVSLTVSVNARVCMQVRVLNFLAMLRCRMCTGGRA
jgi:hypothetical protein